MKRNLWLVLFILPTTLFCQQTMSFQEKQIPEPQYKNSTVVAFNKSQKGYEKLSESEKEFYYLVNYSRHNPSEFFDSVIEKVLNLYPQLQGPNSKSLKSDFATTANLPLLTLNENLLKMAHEHSIDITSNNASPSHNATNGESFSDRVKSFNIQKCASENISYGQDEPVFLLTLLYLDINIPNLGHRKSLLNANFTATGISASYFKDGSIFLVEDFACPQN